MINATSLRRLTGLVTPIGEALSHDTGITCARVSAQIPASGRFKSEVRLMFAAASAPQKVVGACNHRTREACRNEFSRSKSGHPEAPP